MRERGVNPRDHNRPRDESGIALVAIVTVFVPILLAIGMFSVAMTGRSNELRVELDRERALLAAESGIDEAIYYGKISALILMGGGTYTRDLGGGMSYSITPTHLLTDGVDNDKDGKTDAADDDEDVFQVVSVGTYRGLRRRLAAYLGPVPLLPTITAAIGTENPSPTIILKGTPLLSGNNVQMNGTPAAGPVAGLSIAPPGTTATLLAELTPSEQSQVVGLGSPPSLGTIPTLNLTSVVTEIQNVANLILTSDKYASYSFGNGSLGTANITYRNGDVTFSGNSQGAGILAVTGNLELKGNFRFDGVIIVLGDIENSAGTADVYGAILQGPAGGKIEVKGTMNVHYSSEAIQLANSTSGQYVSFNGWQELSK